MGHLLSRLLPASLLFLLLAGCGGGNHSVTFNGARTRGIVQLPPGLTTAVSTLVPAAPNSTAVDSSGGFVFDRATNGSGLVVIADAAGNPLLAGFTDSASVGPIQFNTTSTAIAILFYATGSFTLPPEEHVHVRDLISQSSATPALATALDQALASGSTPVMKDAGVQAAVDAAMQTMQAGRAAHRSATASTSANTAKTVEVSVTRASRAGSISLILAQPSTPQSGVIVGASDDMTGLQITNTKRRNLLFFIRQVSYDDAQGVAHPVDIPLRTGQFPGDWVPATNKLVGALGSVVDVVSGNGSYRPVNSGIIPLPVNPATATKSTYLVTVAGPGVDPGTTPREGPSAVKSGASGMLALGFTKDIFLPFLFTALDIHLNLDQLINQQGLLESAHGLIAILASGGHVAIGLTSFNPHEIMLSVLKAMTDDYVFRQAILNWFTDTLFKMNFNPGKLLDVNMFLTKISFILAFIDKAFALGDAAVTTSDWNTSTYFNEWDVTVIPPTVRINPDGQTVLDLNTLTLTAQTQVQGNLVYHWTTNSQYGSLVDTKPNPGNGTKDLTTTSSSINYVGDRMPPARPGVTESVSVDVSLIPVGGTQNQRIPIGKGTASIIRMKADILTLPTSLVVEDAGFSDPVFKTPRVAIFYKFPITQGIQTYELTATDNHGHSKTLLLKASDIGPATPTGEYLDPATTANTIKTGIIAGGGVGTSGPFRRGNDILLEFGATTYTDGLFPTRQSAVDGLFQWIQDNGLKLDVVAKP